MKEDPLDRQLEALRQELQAVAPPESVARAIAAAARGARSRSSRAARPGWRERWIALPLAVAAAVAVIAWTLHAQRGEDPGTPPEKTRSPLATEFIPLVPVGDIARDEGAYVVSTPMPRMMLAEFGLPVDPARAADSVSSELLVRRDGTVLAVRFID